jgi:hypothetical protein
MSSLCINANQYDQSKCEYEVKKWKECAQRVKEKVNQSETATTQRKGN